MTQARLERGVLQVCPNDHPPFRDLCAVYQRAVRSLGYPVQTVFLAPPYGAPLADAIYLGQTSLRSSRRLGKLLAARLHSPAGGYNLALCHRHRALASYLGSGLAASHTVCVAHEFGFFRRRRRRLRRRLAWRRVTFAGVSEPLLAELAAHVADPVLLPNCIDITQHAQQRLTAADACARLGLSIDAFNVGVVGRLHPKKQPQLALAGFAAFAEAQHDACLTFVGAGELADELRQSAAQLPVRFAGELPDARSYLAAFDALLICSEDVEAFNMVSLEAMAAGVPVVAGPAPGPRFVLGPCGVYFDTPTPAAIAAALASVRDRFNRQAAAQQARQRVQAEFSVAAAAQRLSTWLLPAV